MSVAWLALALLVAWAVVLLGRDRRLPAVKPWIVKPSHIIPAALQILLFVWWGLHSDRVVHHVPEIVVQLAFAGAFEFLLAWTLHHPWQPGFGVLPVVLSANLFVWFPSESFWLGFLVVALALASKQLLRWNGRHWFNPSVFGIAVVGSLCVLFPRLFHYTDISHLFASPPGMAALIFVLALVPQLRFRITPVAVGAAVGVVSLNLLCVGLFGYRHAPGLTWPPWLLAITFLLGDPATVPAALLARFLFGLFAGVSFFFFSNGMSWLVGTDFFSKVLPIPFANLLVPQFERAGAGLLARWPRLAGGNRLYLAIWVVFCAVGIATND